MKTTITGLINTEIFELLDGKPEGIRWADLLKMVQEKYPQFHPKTINGCVWKLIDKYPDTIYKAKKGVFRLVKYKNK